MAQAFQAHSLMVRDSEALATRGQEERPPDRRLWTRQNGDENAEPSSSGGSRQRLHLACNASHQHQEEKPPMRLQLTGQCRLAVCRRSPETDRRHLVNLHFAYVADQSSSQDCSWRWSANAVCGIGGRCRCNAWLREEATGRQPAQRSTKRLQSKAPRHRAN